MISSPLTLRVSRRAVGAAQLSGESLVFFSGRHLTSRIDRALPAVATYIRKLIELTKPSCIAVDAPPRVPGRITDGVLKSIEDIAHERGLSIIQITKLDVLSAYGATALRSRPEVRDLVEGFWPELKNLGRRAADEPTSKRRGVAPYIMDAAAAALFAEVRLDIDRPPL